MKQFWKNKIFKIFLLFFVLLLSLACLDFFNKKQAVKADSSDNLSGFVWNDMIGWFSFNSTDCDTNGNGFIDTDAIKLGCGGDDATTPVFDYGVTIDSATKDLTGYAWNSGVGWMYFGPDIDLTAEGYGQISSSSAPTDPKIWAHFDDLTGQVTGWAKILSMGDDGWVKMSDETDTDWVNKGVTINTTTGDFSGWAYNNNDDGFGNISGIGWISFNCANETGVCVNSQFKIAANSSVPSQPTIGAIEELSGDCKTIRVNWTDNSSSPEETGFKVEFASSSLNWIEFCNTDKNVPACVGLVEPNTTYYFRVKAQGGIGDSAWSPDNDGKSHTTSYCPPVLEVSDHDCSSISLSWTQTGTGVVGYEIYRSLTKDGIYALATTSLSDVFDFEDTGIDAVQVYYYKVRALSKEFDSNIVGPINPCFNSGECIR